jgi:hypothetical protein
LAFVSERTLDKPTSEAIKAFADWLTKNSYQYTLMRTYAELPAKFKTSSGELRDEVILIVLEEAGANVFDPDAYLSDDKAAQKGKDWNEAARKRQLERSAYVRAFRLRENMSEGLTKYIRLNVAH